MDPANYWSCRTYKTILPIIDLASPCKFISLDLPKKSTFLQDTTSHTCQILLKQASCKLGLTKYTCKNGFLGRNEMIFEFRFARLTVIPRSVYQGGKALFLKKNFKKLKADFYTCRTKLHVLPMGHWASDYGISTICTFV